MSEDATTQNLGFSLDNLDFQLGVKVPRISTTKEIRYEGIPHIVIHAISEDTTKKVTAITLSNEIVEKLDFKLKKRSKGMVEFIGVLHAKNGNNKLVAIGLSNVTGSTDETVIAAALKVSREGRISQANLYKTLRRLFGLENAGYNSIDVYVQVEFKQTPNGIIAVPTTLLNVEEIETVEEIVEEIVEETVSEEDQDQDVSEDNVDYDPSLD